ncbi:transcriptional regulator with XRE-family HTH domain [Saccharothrix ecbatanensis]|uniref:Transcriptional regulator with XRE-family HTH domain n=1 Tax=Saccharothrix ecbatanensis TaxID=1105145 RepID=A0A7W9HM29_9PSEU|nr:helix-turn-helix transcriptional regulator [Saccharothrix ecbatanensis]MBB5804650.1 transcriptional regulator with XRE-family HTH domain [Saccharothrix ecbatanensis]
MELPERLRTARVAAGLSLSAMSTRTNYSKAHLGQLETGVRAVRPEHVKAYEDALGVSLAFERTSVGSPDVELLSQATDVITAVGLRHGGQASVPMAQAQWTWASSLLKQTMPDSTRLAMSWQAGRLADRLAWSLSESGRGKQATGAFRTALDLSAHDHELHAVVTIDLAKFMVESNGAQNALELLRSLNPKRDVHQFTAHGVMAHAHAALGDWEGTVRHVGLADDAWSRVDLVNLPEVNRPYASGHEAHAHREAGRAFHALAVNGVVKAIPLARQRLELAVMMFGPDRANAVAACQRRLDDLL